MSTSLLIDTDELIDGALVIGDTGHGKLGSSVPSIGTHGPAFAYDMVILQPGYSGKEYRGTLGTLPAGLNLFAHEDTSFTAKAPKGSYVVPWTLYEDGVLVGTSTFTLVFG
jgi:hypothetical protein